MSRKTRFINQLDEPKAKLKQAFKLMRTKGLLARMNFSCCQTCGSYELSEQLDDSKNSNKIGFAYYHHQDNSNLYQNGYTLIAYSARDIENKKDQEKANIKVANIIKDSLEESGLEVEWNGNTDTRIKAILIK